MPRPLNNLFTTKFFGQGDVRGTNGALSTSKGIIWVGFDVAFMNRITKHRKEREGKVNAPIETF
jgi:hypothetical protein